MKRAGDYRCIGHDLRRERPVNHKNPKERAQSVGRATGGEFMIDGTKRHNLLFPLGIPFFKELPGERLPGEGFLLNLHTRNKITADNLWNAGLTLKHIL